MSEELEKAQDLFLDRINQICNKFGLNNIMAQLYAILYLSNKPLSLDDMVERLKISKGSVSINIRAVERYGAVRRVWVKGSRRDHYEAEADIAKVIMDRIKSMAQSRLSEVNDMISFSYHALNSVNSSDNEEKGAIEIFRQRLDKLKDLQDNAQSLFNLFNSGLLNSLLNRKTKTNEKEVSFV
jgi:DNA-binding transcriptional regulator GbsR (MarR family)